MINYQHSSQYIEYLKWLSILLECEGLKCGKIYQIKFTPNSFSVKDSYFFHSKNYEFLLNLYNQFYPKNKKEVPHQINYDNPALWLHFYLGDGSLHKKDKKGNAYIRFSTEGFSIYNVEFLCQQLNQLGIIATTYKRRNSKNIRISAYSTKQFLNYIGPCPIKCYEYKWKI